MKPTQQEIIELAREASGHTYPEWLYGVPMFALERLVHLALDRFGTGGGELPFLENPSDSEMEFECVALPPRTSLYLHPSPTDLRAEYLRGLEDAKAVAKAGYDAFWTRHEPEFPKTKYDQASVLRTMHATVEFVSTDIADAIEALKGKQ